MKGYISIIISIAGFLVMFFVFIARLDRRLSNLEIKMEPFWKLVERSLPKLLMQPTHLHKDDLLQKMECKSLSYYEAVELKCILEEELIDENRREYRVVTILIITQLEGIINQRSKKTEEK